MDIETLCVLLEHKNYIELKNGLRTCEPADIAEYIDTLDEKQVITVFRLLPKDKAADVFSYLPTDRQLEISGNINENELIEIIADLYFDDKVDLLDEMPAEVVNRILKNTSAVERRLINQFLKYPENSAGSLMTIEYVDLDQDMTVGEALEKIRRTAPDRETIYTCYITDQSKKLEGTVTLKELVLSREEQRVGDIMKADPISVNTHYDQEHTAEIFKKYDMIALPVTDDEGRLVGIITIDDVIDVIERENTEDFHKMAAMQPIDDSYMDSGVAHLAGKQIPWLLVLMISATFTGYIIKNFESSLQSAVILAAFIPMLMGTGGNAGSQSSAIVIRSLVLGEVDFRDIFRVAWKEMRIGIVVGAGLALLNFVRIRFIESQSTAVAAAVVITLVFTVLFAKTLGGILPVIAKKLGADPALMASPLITTAVDAITLLIYFFFASLFLNI